MSGQVDNPGEKITNIAGTAAQATSDFAGKTQARALSTNWEIPNPRQTTEAPATKKTINPAVVLIGGKNFGCGSSRQQAPANLKMLGIGCVIAESFGRIFFRNSVAIALPVMACPGITEAFNEGDDLQLDFEKSVVKNLTQGTELKGAEMPEDLLKIVRAGGVMAVLKEEARA